MGSDVKYIAEIDNAPQRISGIDAIEVLERLVEGIVGLKWREARIFFGKSATEVMWITDAKPPEYHNTRAESHGMSYLTKLSPAEQGDKTLLSMDFTGEPQ